MKKILLGILCLYTATPLNSYSARPAFKKVVTIIFENANYADAIKQSYFSKLVSQGALFTQFIAEAHPSQANYIALTAGDTLGVQNDGIYNLNTKHVGNLLEEKGLDWRVYAENLPSPCFLGAAQGRYVRKHVPFLSYVNVQTNPVECEKVTDASSFQSDVMSGTLPAFSLYIPNMDNDGHDTGARYASNWLSTAFGPIFGNPELMKETLFVITFDESGFLSSQNRVYTVLLGANVIPGSTVSTLTSHYTLLRTVEDNFKLGTLGRKDLASASISGIWR